jgi:hypothetical protein
VHVPVLNEEKEERLDCHAVYASGETLTRMLPLGLTKAILSKLPADIANAKHFVFDSVMQGVQFIGMSKEQEQCLVESVVNDQYIDKTNLRLLLMTKADQCKYLFKQKHVLLQEVAVRLHWYKPEQSNLCMQLNNCQDKKISKTQHTSF